MAKEYLEKQSDLVSRLNVEYEAGQSVEVKHLFATGGAGCRVMIASENAGDPRIY